MSPAHMHVRVDVRVALRNLSYSPPVLRHGARLRGVVRKHHDVHDPFGEAPVHLFDKSDQNLPEDDIGRRRRDYRRSLEVKHSSKRTDFSNLYTDR